MLLRGFGEEQLLGASLEVPPTLFPAHLYPCPQ